MNQNGAGYQHSGTENLRGNEALKVAPVISDNGPKKNVIPASYQHSGTENIRGNERDIHHPMITGSANGASRFKPATVKTFKDNVV